MQHSPPLMGISYPPEVRLLLEPQQQLAQEQADYHRDDEREYHADVVGEHQNLAEGLLEHHQDDGSKREMRAENDSGVFTQVLCVALDCHIVLPDEHEYGQAHQG